MVKEEIFARYPQLLFLLNTQQRCKTLHDDPGIPETLIPFMKQVRLQNPELILLIGLGSVDHFMFLESWLKDHPETDVLLFEEELDAIAAFLEDPYLGRMLLHPQIHLRYILEHAELIQGLKEAVKEYPSENILIEVVGAYRKHYVAEDLSLSVLRRATIVSGLFNEDVYYHLLFRNLLANFLRLPDSFYADTLKGQFQGIPAIICGAGPSLTAHLALLKELGTKALIIAGGSTLAALSSQGVHPHIGLALDPNPEEYDRLKANYDVTVPLLFGSRVAAAVFRTCNGPIGYMKTFSGGFAEQALEEKLGLKEESLFEGVSQEGMSVTVMCVAAALRFGCQPLFLSGIDLAYTGGKRYAEGVVQDPAVKMEELHKDHKSGERVVCRENRHGKKVYTTVKWIMEAQAIEDLALLYPDVEIYDCIEGGLGFKSFEYIPLSDAVEKHLEREYDLQGYVHHCIENTPKLHERRDEVVLFIEALQSSVQRSHAIVASFLEIMKKHDPHQDPEENSRLTLCAMDLEKEQAFEYLLEPLEELITRQLYKELRSCFGSSETQPTYFVQGAVLEKKWKHFDRLLNHYMTLFSLHA